MTETEEYSRKVYKLDSAGKVRILHVYTEGPELIQESGLLDGKKVEHRSTATAKNVGRSNETTPQEQAQSEAESLVVNKMSTGYFDTIEEAKANIVMLPMLAKPWDIKRIDWAKNVFIQPKLDGMRCFAIVTDGKCELYSRKGKVIDTCQHIIDAIEAIPGIQSTVLDGELYAHGQTFQENMKLIKKYREGETEDVCLHMYDTVEDTPYVERYRSLNLVVKIANNPILLLVSCDRIGSEAQIAEFHSANLAAGYEGSIIRHGDDGYKLNKRANQLLKYKDFIDEVYDVVDVVPSDKNPKQGVVHCKLPDGRTFGCGMKFSHKEREEILENKEDYIGKQMSETRFFEFSDDGIPRFPVCVGFRLDK
jgi:ATP-dependent DNA ligase